MAMSAKVSGMMNHCLEQISPDWIAERLGGKKGCAVVLRFEGCLCEYSGLTRFGNVLEFPLKGLGSRCPRPVAELKYELQPSFRPVEFDAEIRRILSELHWKNGALWLLKSLSRQDGLHLFIVSDYPQQLVQRKIRSAALQAQIIGSIVEYEAEAGLYQTRLSMNQAQREAFVEGLRSSGNLSPVIYLGARADDLSSLERVTGIFIGPRAQSAGPGQFSVRNLMEANSVIRAVAEKMVKAAP